MKKGDILLRLSDARASAELEEARANLDDQEKQLKRIETLDDIDTVKLDFSMPETFLSVIRPGQPVLASSVAFPDDQFEGQVATVGSRIDPVSRAVAIRAHLPNPEHQLRPGMLLTIDLEKDRLRTILIPEEAIVPIEDRSYVFVVENGRAKRTEVQTGQRVPGVIEIIEGLEAGQKIIIDGAIRLRDGSEIRITAERNGISSARKTPDQQRIANS